MPNTNASGAPYSTSGWLNNHFSIKSRGRFSYIEQIPIKRGDQILDLGCANGSWSRLMAERVGSSGKVKAIDKDKTLIDLATRSISGTHLEGRLEFFVRDLPEGLASITENFDVATAFNFISLMESPRNLLKVIYRLLRINRGLLILKDSAISTDFYWPMDPLIAREFRTHVTSGGRIGSYDPNFALTCREMIEKCGFYIEDTLLHSYAFTYPFTHYDRHYISTNAAMASQMASNSTQSDQWCRWISQELNESGSFFENPEALYTTTEFTYLCTVR